jgi:hypothetical protein
MGAMAVPCISSTASRCIRLICNIKRPNPWSRSVDTPCTGALRNKWRRTTESSRVSSGQAHIGASSWVFPRPTAWSESGVWSLIGLRARRSSRPASSWISGACCNNWAWCLQPRSLLPPQRRRANHTLQRTGGQRCVAAQRLRQRVGVVRPPPLSVSVRQRRALR